MSTPNPYESPRVAGDPPEPKSTEDVSKPSRTRALLSLFLGAASGWGIWQASPAITGHPEPWDGDLGLYLFCLLLAGALATVVYPRNCLGSILGVYLGQVAFAGLMYAPTQAGPQILPATIAVAIFGMLPAVIGAAAITLLYRAIIKRR